MFVLHRENLRPFFRGLLILSLLLSACSGAEARAWLNAPDWSHGLAVEKTRIGDPAAITIDDEGGIYLFLVTAVNEQPFPKVIALNRQAEIAWEQTLPMTLSQPDKPSIMWDGNLLNLFWLTGNSLYQAQLDRSGQIMTEPRLLSGDQIVDGYDVAVNPDGSLAIWYGGQRRAPGVYALTNGNLTTGNLTAEAVLVDAEGIRPSLQYDGAGNLQATWAHYPPGYSETMFFYAVYPEGVYEVGRETAVYEPSLSTSDILAGPWLGMDDQQAYLVWNISVRTGPEAGKSLTEYIHFPQQHPDQASEAKTIVVPYTPDLDYTYQPDGGLAAGKRVFPISGLYPLTPTVTDTALDTINRPATELALAFDASIQHEFRKDRGQVGVIFLQNGDINGYQLLSFTPEASIAPAIVSDEIGQIYLTWLERDELAGFQIYFASTAPEIREALSGMTKGDFTRITREAAFGLLSGAVLSPILVALWTLLPMAVLFVTSILRRGQPGKRVMIGTIISLLLAGTVYWLVKLTTLPGIRNYVPFSAWVPGIPTGLQAPLQIGVPLLITLLGIAAAWYFTYRRHSESILNFLFIFAAVEGLLTMAVYGFLFYNVI